ncbi:LysM peptidoglycan-binding domain-containing protein [Nonomuraea africana]|uniref:LysM peptidoglycan-binding domain-containing protein n=1 Tax=Nonomuraea africana TaxID=46171 RepID=UPI0033F328BF
MGLLTRSLFQPVQDWIRAELGTPPGAPVEFRFDRFGVTLTDADFMLPGQPQLGFSPEMAIERFSDLVNRTPVDQGTGDGVVFSEIDIDTSYFFRIVNPAEPHLPANLNSAAREHRIAAFNVLKAEALNLWENLGLASVTGQIREFRPSTPEPINWYDPNATGWQRRTFTVSGSDDVPSSATLQWRLRPDNVQIGKALGLTAVEVQQLPAIELLRRAAALQRGEPVSPLRAADPVRPDIIRARGGPQPGRVRDVGLVHRGGDGADHDDGEGLPAHEALRTFLRPEPFGDLVTLSLSDRVLAKRRLLEDAPVKPTKTSSATTITFDACLVRIDRPWLFWPFLTDATWDVPGLSRGGVTQPGTTGALTWLPTAMLAIRNLQITSAWSAQDVAASATATNFGPFTISEKISNGVLAVPGLQVVGWLLQQLPTLPPNDEAVPAPTPQQEYTVVKGDSLWGIARMMYGDGNRWREIADANHISDPKRLEVGQRLVIP